MLSRVTVSEFFDSATRTLDRYPLARGKEPETTAAALRAELEPYLEKYRDNLPKFRKVVRDGELVVPNPPEFRDLPQTISYVSKRPPPLCLLLPHPPLEPASPHRARP